MIYDNLKTSFTHINTVMYEKLIHFKNLTPETTNVMVYTIKLVNTNKIKLISFFEEKLFSDMMDGKLQSFDIDWGDGTGTKVFTENINTGTYNQTSKLKIEHDYISIPTGQEITIVIMSEYETLCPIAFDESVDGIDICKMAGKFAPISSSLNCKFRPHVRRKLNEISSLKNIAGGSLFKNYTGTTLINIFSDLPELTVVSDDIFDDGCSLVTDITQLFFNDTKLFRLPSFSGFSVVETADSLCENCSSIVYALDLFSHLPIKNVNRGFKNCIGLVEVDINNFIGKTDMNISDIFDGCIEYDHVMIDRLFDQTTFINTKYGGITGAFSNIPELIITETLEEGEEPKPHIMNAYKNSRYYDRLFMNSATDRPFELLLLDGLNLTSADNMFSTDINSNEIYVELPNRKVTIHGTTSSIVEMYKNRVMEIFRYPFIFNNVISLNYTGCFIGNKSLYNDQQIFGDLYQEGMRSGVTPITSTIIYEVELLRSDIDLKFSTVYNKYNPDMNPELDASVEITIGNGTTIINKAELESMKTGLGFKNIRYAGVTGTKTITVKYTHCAPMTLTYEKTSDYTNYRIISANIELFPTDVSYIGKYGLELWSAETVTGDFFRMFYDRPNVVPQTWTDPNTWFSNIFAFFSPKVKTVNKDIFKSIGLVGNITEINDIFRYEYRTDNGRDLFNNFTFGVGLNPFKTFDGTIFRFTPNVTKVRTWFNDSVNNTLINISGVSLNNLFGSLTKLVIIDRVLHSCELNIGSDTNRILWTNNNLVEEVSSYIGRVNYLAKDLLMKPKLKKVYRFHVLHMVNGKDKEDLADCYMDFANSNNDIDLTEMFYDEKFEIPDGFIRNVKGALKFNNCFKGSYRFDIVNDNSLFTNVANKTSGHVSGMEFISLAEPLSMEFNGYDTGTGSIGLKLKDKNGSSHRVVARLYSKDTGRYKLLCTKHVVVSDIDTIPDLNLKTGTTGVKLELWCTTANIYLENLSIMSVKNLSGAYGRTEWIQNIRMKDAYPGLIPSNIICTDMGGPWRNIVPTDGMVNFHGLFAGTMDKSLIDYRILKTSAPVASKCNMSEMFAYGSIDKIDIRMFEVIPSAELYCREMFSHNADENFSFVNLAAPYHFMEILFTRIKDSTLMFCYAAMPRDIFNGAAKFGCDRNGVMLPAERMSINDMYMMFSTGGSSNTYPNNVTESWPEWDKNTIYPITTLSEFVEGRKIKMDDNRSYTNLPNTVSMINATSYFRIFMDSAIPNNVLNIDSIDLYNVYDISFGFYPTREGGTNPIYNLKRDKHWITSTLTSSDLNFRNAMYFYVPKNHSNFKYLIEPFTDLPKTLTVHLNGAFNSFETYAPDNVLFRNINFNGSSGAQLLNYPNYIEYQNIHLTGNQVTFIREELDPNHRFSTYLTVFINYGNGYEEAKWFIVDKNADSYTIDLETSKITNNVVSIKIQSTQCFYLMKTNVDYVEKLEGTYRKDLQPRDSEFFNFDVDYYYFIERFGADLWRDVKIKQGDKFRFGKELNAPSFTQNRLVHIDGSPFRNQSHITNIDRLFDTCKKFLPTIDVLNGLVNVTSTYRLFRHTAVSNILGLLTPLSNLTNASVVFGYNELDGISDGWEFSEKVANLYAMFVECIFRDKYIPKSFWNKLNKLAPINMSQFLDRTNLRVYRNSPIPDNAINLNVFSNATMMFKDTYILDVKIAWIQVGTLDSSKSIDMFVTCSTYEEQSAFEAVYGNQTGVTFKCHEPMIYRSSTANLTGTFKFIDNTECPNPANEYVKIIVDSGVYYRTLTELENTGITVATSKVEIYSDYAIAFDCPNVERLEGRYPAKNGEVSNNTYFKIGYKYPNLTYIDPNLFDKLVNQTDMSGVFSNLSDISLIRSTLFTPMTKLQYVNSMYAGARGTIPVLLDLTKYVGPSTNISRYYALFDSVDIKQIATGSIKINNTANVNLFTMFSGTNAYVDKDPFVGTIDANVDRMFDSCKSLYTEEELITFTKTGISRIEILRSFKPRIGLVNPNSEINLMLLHDTPDAAKIVDILVDWGDGNSNIMVGVRTDIISQLSKVITNSGDITLRIWCSYYGVGVKLKTDSTGSIVKHAGGYVGKYISPIREFTKLYFPEVVGIDSEYIHDSNIYTFSHLFLNSKIKTLPSNVFFLSNFNNLTNSALTFEAMRELESIDTNVFSKLIDRNWDIGYMFGSMSSREVEIRGIEHVLSKLVRIREIWGLFSNNNSIQVTPEIISTISSRLVTDSINITNFCLNNFKKINNVDLLLRNFSQAIERAELAFSGSDISVSGSHIFNSSQFINGSVNIQNIFKNTTIDLTNRLDKLVIGDNDVRKTYNVAGALTGLVSVYSEREIFSNNTITGSSGLITDPRTVMKMTVSAGTLNLKTFVNTEYTSKLLIKKNGIVESLNPYADKSLSVADNDIIEVITFNNIKDAYVTIDLATSTSKVKHLDGILNIGPKSIVDGKFNKTIAEAFGTDIISISDTFLTQFNTVTSASGLCKGLINLTSIPKLMINHMTSVTNWASMFENCNSLVLTQPENSEMFINANKGVCYDYMFKNCTSITMVPEKFFKGCLELDKTFIGAFTNTRLTRLPDDIDEF